MQVLLPGNITAIRWFKPAGEDRTGNFFVIWRCVNGPTGICSQGVLLMSGPVTGPNDLTASWQRQPLPMPIAAVANDTFAVGVTWRNAYVSQVGLFENVVSSTDGTIETLIDTYGVRRRRLTTLNITDNPNTIKNGVFA